MRGERTAVENVVHDTLNNLSKKAERRSANLNPKIPQVEIGWKTTRSR